MNQVRFFVIYFCVIRFFDEIEPTRIEILNHNQANKYDIEDI